MILIVKMNIFLISKVILFLKSTCDDISEKNISRIFSSLDDTGDASVEFEEFKVSRKMCRRSISQEVVKGMKENGWKKCETNKEGEGRF